MRRDAKIVAAVNAHQRTRQGLRPGARAGGGAGCGRAIRAARLCRDAGRVGLGVSARTTARSRSEMLSGWAAAARETGDLPLDRRDRLADAPPRTCRGGRSTIRVGHVDFFARPTGTR